MKNRLLLLLVSVIIVLSGCSSDVLGMENSTMPRIEQMMQALEPNNDGTETALSNTSKNEFDLSAIPEYSGSPYVVVNNNVPGFTTVELSEHSFEKYSELDVLGRCGVAFANVGKEIMPTEERGSIGMVKPTGWHTVKYDVIEDKYLYNRCHLMGYQLTGENANERNLITGTDI